MPAGSRVTRRTAWSGQTGPILPLPPRQRGLPQQRTDVDHRSNGQARQGYFAQDQLADDDAADVGAEQEKSDVAGLRDPVQQDATHFDRADQGGVLRHAEPLQRVEDLDLVHKLEEPRRQDRQGRQSRE